MDSDCEEPICISGENTHTKRRTNKTLIDLLTDEGEEKEESEHREDCPLGKEDLGYFTWGFLHTMSVYYPLKPNPKQKKKMSGFLDGFAEFYPCKTCAVHLRTDLKRLPPQLDSREDFAVWMCNLHNETNKLLHKPLFDCDYNNIKKRGYKNNECQKGNLNY